jgi:hypothetical protein
MEGKYMEDLLEHLKVIEKIEKTRQSNNNNWMELLRIAFTADPENTKIVLKKIIEHDEKIIKQFKELIK